MCGIVGIVSKTGNDRNIENVRIAINNLNHRGPDNSNLWFDREKKVVIGHSRLAIRDLSSLGNQPVLSKDGRFVLSYNGEIYNCGEIIKFLKLHTELEIKSNCDTEILIKSIEILGLDNTLDIIQGMYAFALFDQKEKKFYLVRDKSGQKPIYYSFADNFFFASEIKSLPNINGIKKKISKTSVQQFLDFSYIKAPNTIYEEISQLLPGSYLELNLKDQNQNLKIKKYWSYSIKEDNLSDLETSSKNLEQLLYKSVKSHMVSDVPLGVFLSGGIDSSLITAIASKIYPNKLKTFTVGFDDKNYDETLKAKKISKSLSTDHYELLFSQREIFETIEKLFNIYSDPFADSSQIPCILLSKFAKKEISVALTGDGGDELFGGYNRYIWTNKLFNFFNSIGKNNSLIFSKILKLFTLNNSFSKSILNLTDIIFNLNQSRDKVFKLIQILENIDSYDLFYESILKTNNFSKNLFNKENIRINLKTTNKRNQIIGLDKILLNDFNDYLPNDILCKIDRSSMSQSLETRIPLLDDNIIDFASSLSQNHKVDHKSGKIILKKILENYIPKNLIYSPKSGFGPPLNHWFNTFLFKWIDNLYQNHEFSEEYNLNNKLVKNIWEEFKKNKFGHEKLIWNIVVLKQWDLNRCY